MYLHVEWTKESHIVLKQLKGEEIMTEFSLNYLSEKTIQNQLSATSLS